MKFNEIHGLGLYSYIWNMEPWLPQTTTIWEFCNDQSTHKYDDDLGMVYSWAYHFN